MTTKPRLSIILPNYNEKANLSRGVLDEVNHFLHSANFTWEVIISDDGSTDGSVSMIKNFVSTHKGFRFQPNQHGGKAHAVYQGILAATGEIILFTDMDQSTPLSEVSKLLPWYDHNFDVVFGSRGKLRRNFPWHRQLMSWGFRHLRQLFLLHDVSDTQCGFKSLRRSVALTIFPQLEAIKFPSSTTGWNVSAFDVELLFLAQKYGYRLKEVEVNWRDEDVSTTKSKNFLKESLDMLQQIMRVKLNAINNHYHKKL